MSKLSRKLWRDMARMRPQLLAIVLVVACGVASFVSMLSVHGSLERSGDTYFERYRFPDLFARVNRAPDPVADRIGRLAGVESVQTRISRDVTLDVEGLSEPAVGTLVSIPEDRQPTLSRLHLRSGRWVAPGRTGEVIVGEAFAIVHGLEAGDSLVAVIAGQRQTLEIVGVALSPEHIFNMAPGSPWPDDKRYTVLWMGEKALAAAVDMDGGFNEIVMTISPHASKSAIAFSVDRVLAPYGCLGAHGRDKQTSARFVKEELEQLESFGAAMPVIFLGVAAFLLNVVMSRLITGQREQIAALKALGYGNTSIALHYAQLVAVIAVGGSLLGGLLGATLGDAMIGMYHQFFRFPSLEFELDLGYLAIGTALSLGAGAVGTARAVRKAVSMPPAEAMRPPAPAKYRKGILERLGLTSLLSPVGRIVLRNLLRRPIRTVSSVLGVALSMSILIAGTFGIDAVDYVMSVNYELAQREDLTVYFGNARDARAVEELRRMPGVIYAEPARDVPVRLWSRHHRYETAIQGIPANSTMRRLIGEDLDPVPIPSEGVLITRELGERLEVGVGDEVTVEVLEGDRIRRSVKVAGLTDEMLGFNAYMEVEAVNELLSEGPKVSGARLLLDPAQVDKTYVVIKQLPAVAGATLRTAAYDIFNETTKQMQLASALILSFFAAIVAAGVMYNGARVVLAERSRELASLRVLGFTRIEISYILLGELGTQLLLALPLGCGLGYVFAWAAMAGVDAELYRFPVVIDPSTYVIAIAVVVVVGTASALIVRSQLDRLDLVEVLKTRE